MAAFVGVSSYALSTDFMIFGVSLALCALTAFLETSITTLRIFKIKELARSSTGYADLLAALEKNQSRVLTTILIAKNLVDVTAATFGGQLFAYLLAPLPDVLSLWLSIGIVTILILVFGEIIPKIIAKTYGNRFFASTLGIISAIYYLFYPIVNYLMPVLHSLIAKVFGGKNAESNDDITSESELKFLLGYITEKGIIDTEKSRMIKNIFELGGTSVRDIMVPETSIVSLDLNLSIAEALDIFSRHNFSRLPAYVSANDNIIGMIHFKDVFNAFVKQQDYQLKDIIRPILFIPEGTRITQVLKDFKAQGMHMAVVINEYGSIIGLITLEDILEEIVGEIHDEYELVPQKIVSLKEDSWLIDASIDLKELSSLLNISLQTEGAHTLNGFLNEQFQHVPKKGERLEYKNYCFQVQQAASKKVLQVLVFKDQ